MEREFLQAVVNFIESSNQTLAKYAALNETRCKTDAEYQVKIAEAVNILTDQGLVDQNYREPVTQYLQEHPIKAAEFMAKLATARPRNMGQPANLTKQRSDPIMDFIMS